MTKVDRQAEIEKIADRLGVGKDRDVECVGCQTTFRFKEAVILTDGGEAQYLCQGCFKELKAGKLARQGNEWLDALRQLKKDNPAPQIGRYPDWQDPIIWKSPVEEGTKYTSTYTVNKADKMFAFEPMYIEKNYGN